MRNKTRTVSRSGTREKPAHFSIPDVEFNYESKRGKLTSFKARGSRAPRILNWSEREQRKCSLGVLCGTLYYCLCPDRNNYISGNLRRLTGWEVFIRHEFLAPLTAISNPGPRWQSSAENIRPNRLFQNTHAGTQIYCYLPRSRHQLVI